MKIRKVNESESPGLDELISYLNEDKDFNGVKTKNIYITCPGPHPGASNVIG